VSYAAFLDRKRREVRPVGRPVDSTAVSPVLHEWQSEIVRWACEAGRAAIFADCGLGKTFMQAEASVASLFDGADAEGAA
jgi:hypothetical protein